MIQNTTLAHLAADDAAALLPHIVERHRQRGEVLTIQGEAVETVYFPATAHLSNVIRFANGKSSESFVMGNEGVTGLTAFLAEQPCAWSVEARLPGTVYQIAAETLRMRFKESETLRTQLLRLAYDYQAQAALSAACSRHHVIPARLATTILQISDRLGVTSLELTQHDFSDMLGVQRSSVNAGAINLKAAGAVNYSRGVMHIVSRPRLEAAACECLHIYEAVNARRDAT